MSRDFTPMEYYNCDKYMTLRGESLRESRFTIRWQMGKTPESLLFTPSQKKTVLKFRELGFLFERDLLKLWDETKDYSVRRRAILDWAEEELRKVITAVNTNVVTEELDKTIYSWYLGELDKNFYYNKLNNQLLYNYLYEKITGKNMA